MNRKDAHLDAMLRHLGAAYYDSLHGKAAPADVARALDSVAGQIGEEPTRQPMAAGHNGSTASQKGHCRWHSRVQDVMTTSVVAVDRITPYKEIAKRLAQHKIGGVPVLTMGRHVAGVVSEGDLLAARDRNPSAGRRWLGRPSRRQRHRGTMAEDLMTSPAITIRPDATISAAARLMNAHHVRFLPVVDSVGRLLGIVSRRDLLSVFLRPDPEIARQVTEILSGLLPGGATGLEVSVRNGVVTLTGEPERRPRKTWSRSRCDWPGTLTAWSMWWTRLVPPPSATPQAAEHLAEARTRGLLVLPSRTGYFAAGPPGWSPAAWSRAFWKPGEATLKVANTRCRPTVSMPSRRNWGMSAAVFGSATGPKQP
jgi:CBS domain-containing protein